jgi:2-methylisocitrate lyase-like PEP mutase family enzyme
VATDHPAPRPTWRGLLADGGPLLLPAAHDALTARLIARAGFRAYQVGGFALAGARYALPDVGLVHQPEEAEAVRQAVAASPLPVLADAGDGFGDAKAVARTVRDFEAAGASALFLEDQAAPIRCGQMGEKAVVPVGEMVGKLGAALDARASDDTFLLARTDARGTEGVDGAIRRGEAYRDAGADGVYVEGLRSADELARVGTALDGTPLAATLMEGGGQLPWMPPAEIHGHGFAMILYPTTVLFRVAWAIGRALDDLAAGRPMDADRAVDLDGFEAIVGLAEWRAIEGRSGGG